MSRHLIHFSILFRFAQVIGGFTPGREGKGGEEKRNGNRARAARIALFKHIRRVYSLRNARILFTILRGEFRGIGSAFHRKVIIHVYSRRLIGRPLQHFHLPNR